MTHPKLARYLEAGQEQVFVYPPPLQHVPEYPNQLSSLASRPVAQKPSFFQLSSHQNYGVSGTCNHEFEVWQPFLEDSGLPEGAPQYLWVAMR